MSQKSKETEKIDLSKGRDLNEYAKYGPRDYRKLHHLHKSVSKGPSVPTITKTKPLFSHLDGKRPNISFLTHEVENPEFTTGLPNDHDGHWMDDLPSLSAVLSKKRNSPENCSAKDFPNNSNSGFERNSSDYEDGFELSDIIELDRNPKQKQQLSNLKIQGQGADQKEVSDEVLPTATHLVTFSQHENQELAIDSDDRLFCSTDSPEKPAQSQSKEAEVATSRPNLVAGKRISVVPLESELSPGNLRIAKRQRINAQNQEESTQSLNIRNNRSQSQPEVGAMTIPNLERPRPAWVEEFDPEFIAEYADFVEFI